MFWIILEINLNNEGFVYLCKASSLERALKMTGLSKEETGHVVITEDNFNALNQLDGGYVMIEL